MLLCMRTTINLDDHLLVQIKEFAAKNGQTMTSVIEDALRRVVSPRETIGRKKIHLTTVNGKGIRPGIDLDDSASLLDFMDRGK